ncbi:MAG: C1 family peptidase [Paraprevotella sp.]|nr:C1 family peptidase [Paraprevotella sp.]
MRHTATILIGQDLMLFAARLGKYIMKYGEVDASSYFTSMTWSYEDGKIEIKKAVRDGVNTFDFVSTMKDLYNTKLEEIKTLVGADRDLNMRHFFQELHQNSVTINNPGDTNSLLLPLVVPMYDAKACEEAISIIGATSNIQSRYTIMLIGLCENLGSIISKEEFGNISLEEETKKKDIQKQMLKKFADLKLEQNTLEQIVILQNTNSDGYALNLDSDSFIRILGELTLICIEKYNVVFPQASIFDREHLTTALGLSVMNLDKYYFENYLLRRAYLRIMEREDVTAEEVDLNKVAIIANACLAKHKNFFSNFYQQTITPLWRKNISQDTIISQTAKPLDGKCKEVSDDLTSYILDPQYSLPEKQAIMAMLLGYDDAFLKGNLFTDEQLTIDNLDEEVANQFIEANNACVLIIPSENPEREDSVIYGPLGDLCADAKGHVTLPIDTLQKLRNEIRQSTNYIREKSKELDEIDTMIQNAENSAKRLTERGFMVEGNEYHFDIKHEELKFNETYEAKEIKEKSVNLKKYFTKVKDQGQIGACTVFAISSIYEYILKRNSEKEVDLSESFVYYNVRHLEGKEQEDTGSSFQDVIASMGKQGICTELLHPYTHLLSDIPSDGAYQDGKKRRIVKALNVNVALDDIRSAIQDGYPVAISLKIFESFNTTTGFVKRPTKEEVDSEDFGYHAMVVVGYSDDTKFFLVRNSWGEKFGEKGYCYIPYSYISDPDLNRMACIVTEVCYQDDVKITFSSGNRHIKQTVQFNMNDAVIKNCVIRNLVDEENVYLKKMQEEDAKVKMDYEKLMQALGKQSERTKITKRYMGVLDDRIKELEKERDKINETERVNALRKHDFSTMKIKLYLIIIGMILAIIWGVAYSFYDNFIDWFQNEWCYILTGVFGLVTIILMFYWWWSKGQRRRLEIEYEGMTAELSEKIHSLQEYKNEQKMKMHVAGMVIDKLLELKVSIDKTYQVMKAYIGNLAIWYKEERKGLDIMEPLVKDPFIPLLSNNQLNNYFEENKDEITAGMHLYEYFKDFQLDEEMIIAYKCKLKKNILAHIEALLNKFTVFRHIFETMDYPYLDKEYASAKNLLPVLDTKSVPFCQIRRTALIKPQARFLFIHTDAAEQYEWNATYPLYFNMAPISENIASVYKIVALRVQDLTIEEVILD